MIRLAQIAFAFLTISPILFSGCKTDFSLNGEYSITPVVFGLLDQNESVHMIKITKAFLGEGNNLVYAQNPDSNYFNQVDARIIEYIDGDPTNREWVLRDSIIPNKSTDGVFYAPEQKVYVFYASDLNEFGEYELVADLNEGQHQIKARTGLIREFDVSSSLSINSYTVSFAKSSPELDEDYLSWSIDVFEGYNAGQYDHKLIIDWTEYYIDGTSQKFTMEKTESSQIQDKPSKPGTHKAIFSGLDFYKWIEGGIPDDENVERRVLDNLTLKIAAAHEDLATYIDVSKPVTTIGQVQPTYTNIENGLGLFSSRLVYKRSDLILSKSSRRELCQGQYTLSKKFCSDYSTDFSEAWYCP